MSPKRKITAEDLLRIKTVGDAQFSPDGQEILYAVRSINDKLKSVSHLASVDLRGNIHEWTQGDHVDGHGRWSPDGQSIVFLSNRAKTGSQIFSLPRSGGEAKQLTKLNEGSIGGFKFSPDSKWIAFTYRETPEEFTQAAKKKREEEGGATPPRVITTSFYRLDGDGYFGDSRYKLFLLDTQSLEVREIFAGDGTSEIEFDWKPDSSELVVTKSVAPRPLYDPINIQLFRLTLFGELTMIPGKPGGPKSTPRWSPDGSKVAYIGHDDAMDGWGSRSSHVHVVAVEGGYHQDLMQGFDYDVDVMTLSDTKEGGATFLEWAKDGSGLFTQIGHHGAQELAYVSYEHGVKLVTEGHHTIQLSSLNFHGTEIAGIYGNAGQIPEIARVQTIDGQTATLTSYNGWLAEEVELVKPEEHWIESTGGQMVHTWLLKPTDAQAPYPAILEVHGGPHTQYGWAFFHEMQLLAANGYAVAYSNPRGSKGYGEAHARAIEKAWGTVDWQDIESVMIWMQLHDEIDSTRMGIMGGSYGGYMTNWAIGHTKAFKAAITDRCVSNLVSACGNADFPFNARGNFGGTAYGDLADIKPLWRQSPIAFFKGVTTPTLVIHSEGDLRCNIEQSDQVYAALQAQNVPSRYVRYPAETSHGMSRNGPVDLRMHRLGEILDWWAKWI